MRVRYIRIRTRRMMFAVVLRDATNWLLGFIHFTHGRWIARHRADAADKFSHPHLTRTRAAEWLLTTGGWAQRPARRVAA